MAETEQRSFNGVREYSGHIADYQYEALFPNSPASTNTESRTGAAPYPSTFKIDNMGEIVKDQGTISACVGCAMATILEAYFKMEFSEGWDYGALRKPTDHQKGMFHTQAIDNLKKIGGIPKKDFDILLEMPDMQQATTKFPELLEIAKNYRISGYVQMHNGDTSTNSKKDLQIKEALQKYNYPLFAIAPKGFGSSHAICIVGWNDEKNTYYIKNSWGTTYGTDGIGSVFKDQISDVYLFLFEPITLPFNDVKESDWFYPYVKSVYMSGIMSGKSAQTFDPNAPMTRAEMATVVSKLIEKIDIKLDTTEKLIAIKHDYNKLSEKDE